MDPHLRLVSRRFGLREALVSLVPPVVVWTGTGLAILWLMWPDFYHIKARHIVLLGVFTLWRYGWALTNYVRALVYGRRVYPRLRRAAAAAASGHDPGRVFVLVTSYRERPWITLEVFQALLRELTALPCPSTVIVATGSDEEDALIARIHDSHPARDRVELVLQRQAHGKRIAMGHALRAIARRYRDEPHSVTVFMDGDTWLAPGTLARILPFFVVRPRLGALTTNEVAHVHGGSPLFRHWFNLKFGQRHVHFQSQSLSRRVLTLTGRFSVFRTAAVVDEDFIRRVEADSIAHWRHGRVRFLMGDDKSTWFHLLAGGWEMLYLPDVTVCALENRSGPFLRVSLQLMYRWYGNTLRNNRRALRLGPRRIGWFTWYAVLEQRLSMWTALVGVVGATLLTLTKSFVYLPFYLAYVLLVRSVQISAIALGGHPVGLATLPLMLYNQWIGALVKIRAWYHLHDQSWAKNGRTRTVAAADPLARSRRLFAWWSMAVASVAFLFAIALAQRVIRIPPPALVRATLAAPEVAVAPAPPRPSTSPRVTIP